MANHNDEKISDLLDGTDVQFNTANGIDEWNVNTVYPKGASVRILVKGVNYYFVSKGQVNGENNVGKIPPSDTYWIADQCSKTIEGCRLRWKNNPELGEISGPIPFGGFPTSRRAVK